MQERHFRTRMRVATESRLRSDICLSTFCRQISNDRIDTSTASFAEITSSNLVDGTETSWSDLRFATKRDVLRRTVLGHLICWRDSSTIS
eukprot:COSAG02_NODE_5440_length_4328_cov_4.242374_3_plen_90_part_00